MNNSKSRMTKRTHESYSTSYNDPWFYNQKNFTFQINSMKTSSYISRMNGLLSPSKTFVSINMPTESTFEDELPNEFTMISKMNLKQEEEEIVKSYENPIFIYRQIFKSKGTFRKKRFKIDNKLNIDYAENEEQYEKRLLKKNKKLISEGKPINHYTKSDYIDSKLNAVRKKIVFMKGAIDYGYPELVVAKIKEIEKTLKQRNTEEMRKKHYIIPCRERDINTRERNIERKVFLKEAMKIKHIGI